MDYSWYIIFVTTEEKRQRETAEKRELSDLILLKKALYLLKINDKELGIEILSNLIKKDSKLKILAQEIISK